MIRCTLICIIFLCSQIFSKLSHFPPTKPADILISSNKQVDLPKQTHVLSIKIPKKHNAQFYGYYKGQTLIFDKGTCLFDEYETQSKFVIAFTEQIKHITSHQYITHLERYENIPFRLFYITKIHQANSLQPTWFIEEEKKENIPVRLPNNTLVILLDPDIIQEIFQSTSLGVPRQPDIAQKLAHAPITYLPYIQIKPSISREELDMLEIRSILGSIDSKIVEIPERMP